MTTKNKESMTFL